MRSSSCASLSRSIFYGVLFSMIYIIILCIGTPRCVKMLRVCLRDVMNFEHSIEMDPAGTVLDLLLAAGRSTYVNHDITMLLVALRDGRYVSLRLPTAHRPRGLCEHHTPLTDMFDPNDAVRIDVIPYVDTTPYALSDNSHEAMRVEFRGRRTWEDIDPLNEHLEGLVVMQSLEGNAAISP